MEERVSRELIERLMSIKGETRGFNLKHDSQFILKERGEKALKQVEGQLARWGHPIKYGGIKEMGFFPAGLRALSLLAIEKVFGGGDETASRVCAFHPKTSLVVRLFMKYFYSPQKMLRDLPALWRKYWTYGEMITPDFDLEKKYVVLQIRDFELHPIFCRCVEGYITTIAKMTFKTDKAACKERKCPSKGGRLHEFLLTWE